MRKTFKRIIGALLAMVMVFCLGTASFAAGDTGYKRYTCLGDSNAAGYNTTGFIENFVPAPSAYHSLIAKELGAKLTTFAHGGYRTDEMLYLLDAPGFEMDWSYVDICHSDVSQPTLDLFKAAYIKSVRDADILTIQIGSNDFAEDAGFALLNLYTPNEKMEELKASITGTDTVSQLLLKTVETLDFAIKLVKTVGDVSVRAKATLVEFKTNWDAIIERIYELNPDVKIVALSALNGFNNTSYIEGNPIKFGRLFDIYTKQFNYYIENGSEYSDTYLYCDTSDMVYTEMAITQEDFWDVYLAEMHPTDEQHAEIAERVLKLLEEN